MMAISLRKKKCILLLHRKQTIFLLLSFVADDNDSDDDDDDDVIMDRVQFLCSFSIQYPILCYFDLFQFILLQR